MDRESYNFLCSCLIDGFNVLKGVNINFFPKEDKKIETIIQHWAAMMAAQGKWNQKQDSKRIAETFAYISTNIDNFPTLPQFLRLRSGSLRLNNLFEYISDKFSRNFKLIFSRSLFRSIDCQYPISLIRCLII